MRFFSVLAILVFALTTSAVMAADTAVSQEKPKDKIYVDEKKVIHVTPLPMDDKFKNEWTPALEAELLETINHDIKANSNIGYGNTYFENEKRSYPNAMFDFLAGNRTKALAFLQADDNDPWSNLTLKVDLFPSFTLKGQLRKYFYFGEYLDPAYKQKMYDAAKIWTEKDPLGRSNPYFKKSGDGWTPEYKNSWVDVRNTDNLRAMRETAIYLFAEETGNKEVQEIYRKKIQRFVWSLYNIGTGEWDSNNYHGHTISAYINLYDFAKDPEMKLLGKAALDWMYTVGGAKYYHGAFGGPSKRDYGGKNIWGCGATEELGFYFYDAPFRNPKPAPNEVHLATSGYRPPLAVMAFARKEFAKPTEILVTHPSYENWKAGGEDQPQYFETQFYGNSYQLGTMTTGSNGDENGFNLMATNEKRGVDHFLANSGADFSQKGISTNGIGGDNVAQYRNIALQLQKKGDAPFQFMAPKTAKISEQDGYIFLKYEKTWLAVKLINAELTRNDDKTLKMVDTSKTYPDDMIFTAKGTGKADGPVCGFVLEVGEKESLGDFDAFKAAVLAKSKLDITGIADGIASYTGADGSSVKMKYSGSSRPDMWRNGVAVDWSKRYAEYAPADGGKTPVSLGWKEGVLVVEAGGYRFTGTLKDNKYTFTNETLPVK